MVTSKRRPVKRPRNSERAAIADAFVDHALFCPQCASVVACGGARTDETAQQLCAFGRELHAKDVAAIERGIS
jgi:hypothetical protein